jgi:hypothetical protein
LEKCVPDFNNLRVFGLYLVKVSLNLLEDNLSANELVLLVLGTGQQLESYVPRLRRFNKYDYLLVGFILDLACLTRRNLLVKLENLLWRELHLFFL